MVTLRRAVVLAMALALPSVACTRPEHQATFDPSTPPQKNAATPMISSALPTPKPNVPNEPNTPTAKAPGDEIDPQFVGELERAFAAYQSWGRVDDLSHWAPQLCRPPTPPSAHLSVANEGKHARKLYSLFARDREAYVTLAAPDAKPAEGGQVVVKEAYVPELVSATDKVKPSSGFNRYVKGEDGKTYRAGEVASLFVVIEKPSGTSGTDEGFVYGTLTPTGQVTSAGRVASCMGCHTHAKYRRFFGSHP